MSDESGKSRSAPVPALALDLARGVLRDEAESQARHGWTCAECGDRATSHTPSGACGVGGLSPCPCPGYRPFRPTEAILASALLEAVGSNPSSP